MKITERKKGRKERKSEKIINVRKVLGISQKENGLLDNQERDG
jgi:hypothetical protein